MTQCGEVNLEYWSYEEPELDNYLSKFWFGARKNPDSDYESDKDYPECQNLMYSSNTMKSFRYLLNRILKQKGHEYDIMNKNSLLFKHSQQAFLDSQKELKALGKAQINSAPEITEEGKHYLIAFVNNALLKRSCQLIFRSEKIHKGMKNIL